MTTNRSIALVVEGIGSDATLTGGIAWYFGRSTIDTPNGYEWVGGQGSGQGLVAPPASVSSAVNPFDITFRGSAFSFKIHADSVAKLLWLPRPLQPYDSLNAAIDTDATGLVFTGNGTWSSADDNRVVWIGDEAIGVGTHQAGSTFAGATREIFTTQAIYYPAGKAVYLANPRHLGRYCKVIVYDHDAGTVEQVWQGLITSFDVDGPILNVGAREVLTSTLPGMVNRGKAHIRQSGIAVRGTVQIGATGRVRFGTIPYTTPKRVNKASSADAHWLALRTNGAAVYAKWNATENEATLQDSVPDGTAPTSRPAGGNSYNGSKPILGGTFQIERDGVIHELLVVDRLRDYFFGVPVYNAYTGTGTYANMRSSTRELRYPFHPVAISMALLTSGPNPTPGEAGTGAVGYTPVETFASEGYLVDIYEPWSNSTTDINAVCCNRLTGHAIVGDRLGAVSASVKYVDLSDGTVEWTLDNTALSHTSGYAVAIDTDGTDAYILLDGDSAGRYCVQSVSLATGSINWTTQIPVAQSSAGAELRGLVYIPTANLVATSSETAQEIQLLNATTGAITAYTTSGTSLSIGYFADESSLLITDESETVEIFSLPMTTSDTKDTTLNMLSGADSTLVTGRFASSSYCPPQFRAERVTGGTGVWLVNGMTTTASTSAPLWHIESTGSTVDVETDVSLDAVLSPASGSGYTAGMAIDKDGRIYVQYVESYAITGFAEFVVYDTDGTTKLWDSSSMRGPLMNGGHVQGQVDITEDGYLCAGGDNGDLYVYKVAEWVEPSATGFGTTFTAGTAETGVYTTGSEDVGGIFRLGDDTDEFVMYPWAAMGYAGALQVRDAGAALVQRHTWDSSSNTYNYAATQNAIDVDRSGGRIYWAYRGGSGFSLQSFDYDLTAQWTGDGVGSIAGGGGAAGAALTGSTLWRLDTGGAASDLGSWTSLASNPPTTGTAYDPDGSTNNADITASGDGLTLFWTGLNETLYINTVAGIDGTSEYTVDLSAATGVLTVGWPTNVTSTKIVACPVNTDAVWLFPGITSSALSTGEVVRVNSVGTVEVEIDWKDSPYYRHSPGNGQICVGAVDRHGDVYILIRRSGSPNDWTVQKYSNAGVFLTCTWSQGIKIQSSRYPSSMDVTGLNGYIVIGDDDGYIRSIAQ